MIYKLKNDTYNTHVKLTQCTCLLLCVCVFDRVHIYYTLILYLPRLPTCLWDITHSMYGPRVKKKKKEQQTKTA